MIYASGGDRPAPLLRLGSGRDKSSGVVDRVFSERDLLLDIGFVEIDLDIGREFEVALVVVPTVMSTLCR